MYSNLYIVKELILIPITHIVNARFSYIVETLHGEYVAVNLHIAGPTNGPGNLYTHFREASRHKREWPEGPHEFYSCLLGIIKEHMCRRSSLPGVHISPVQVEVYLLEVGYRYSVGSDKDTKSI